MKNVMLDIETMGYTSNSVIVSIAAVPFDLETGKTEIPFFESVSIKSCQDVGLHCDSSTILWWLDQNEHARKKISEGHSVHIKDGLLNLSSFLKLLEPGPILPWGNSASFDCGLLTDAYRACSLKEPWLFWNERCYRTMTSLFPEVKNSVPKPEGAHDPIIDCLYQIQVLTKVWKFIKPSLI